MAMALIFAAICGALYLATGKEVMGIATHIYLAAYLAGGGR